VWLEVTVRSGDRILGRSGARDELGKVDPWSHFVNVFLLDREGRRINRRNAADIFVPLYNHQIPPGAGQTVHYSVTLPADITEPVTVELRLNYRKFDQEYMAIVAEKARPKGKPIRGYQPGKAYENKLPIVEMAFDKVTFPLANNLGEVRNEKSEIPEWQRWNDYGIGLFLKGKAELRQADQAFMEVGRLGRYDGPLNRARVLYREGRLDEAVTSLNEALAHDDPAPPPWTVGWLSGLINREQGQLVEAERNFRGVLEDSTEETRRRKFDFSKDYRVLNLLGETLFDLANREIGPERKSRRQELLQEAVGQFKKTLRIDSENVTAHHNLHLLYATLQDKAKASYHQKLHARYKPDDNARDRAVAEARRRYPAANFAAEALVIYPLDRPGTFGLRKSVRRGNGEVGVDVKGEENGSGK
jgi:tetratricopeptide (TPR) repeat protein